MVDGVRTQALEYAGWSWLEEACVTRVLPPGERDYLGTGSQTVCFRGRERKHLWRHGERQKLEAALSTR